MYTFADKRGRPLCLIPEATAIVQQLYRESWAKTRPKPVRLFYLARCYRYERPQAGRYREFWQLGVELLGGRAPDDRAEVEGLLRDLLGEFDLPWEMQTGVRRGLDYYVEDGFEATCDRLGAQRQIAGGGRYDTGVGLAIGVDRLLLGVERARAERAERKGG